MSWPVSWLGQLHKGGRARTPSRSLTCERLDRFLETEIITAGAVISQLPS